MPIRFLMAVIWVLAGCDAGKTVNQEGEKMGMRWRVQVVGGHEQVVGEEVEQVLERWERATSLWRDDSELSEFNRAPTGQWVKVGAELWSAVALAREIATETEGALDITVAPLVDLWGFGRAGRREAAPSDETVEERRLRCGWKSLEVNEIARAMSKQREGMALDVNCVVEGLALEDLSKRLCELGYRDFLLELGGELLAQGRSMSGEPWTVAVQAPGGRSGESFSTVPLNGGALATSGTYRQRYFHGGHGFSHLIDPGTGRPVTHRLTSVSVFDGHCGRADGFATALLVLGPERGRRVAERLGLRVIWIEEVD
jgi:thiamine biosynthesis lipoprotein